MRAAAAVRHATNNGQTHPDTGSIVRHMPCLLEAGGGSNVAVQPPCELLSVSCIIPAAHLMSAPALRASMKALVPDFAMVPRLFTRSALVMPIPESSMVRVLFACEQSKQSKG